METPFGVSERCMGNEFNTFINLLCFEADEIEGTRETCGPSSRIMGVSAPLRCEVVIAGEELDGGVDGERVVRLLVGLLLPLVATIEGEVGGSGERVK
jgi:hypothetical protein